MKTTHNFGPSNIADQVRRNIVNKYQNIIHSRVKSKSYYIVTRAWEGDIMVDLLFDLADLLFDSIDL